MLTLEEAKALLSTAFRSENRDHAFGDREVFWEDADGNEIAGGYFGGGAAEVSIEDHPPTFEGNDAYELVKCGSVKAIGRNDTTGDSVYHGA